MYPLKLNKDLNSFVLFYFKRDYMYNWQTYPDKSRQRNATSAKKTADSREQGHFEEAGL